MYPYLTQAWNKILESVESPNVVVNFDVNRFFESLQHHVSLDVFTKIKGCVRLTSISWNGLRFPTRSVNEGQDSRGFFILKNTPWGSPQGMLLGNFLTTDDIERRRDDIQILEQNQDDFPDQHRYSSDTNKNEHDISNISAESDPFDNSFRYFSDGTDSDVSMDTLSDESLNNCAVDSDTTEESLKCVDDLLGLEATKFYNSSTSSTNELSQTVLICARQSELFFKSVQKNAADIGMSVNPKKTHPVEDTARPLLTLIQTRPTKYLQVETNSKS